MNQKRDISRRRFLPAGVVAAGAAVSAGGSANLFGQAPAVRSASQHPVFAAVDVLVAGGGPAGIGAALGAARAGAKTLLVENHSFSGAWRPGPWECRSTRCVPAASRARRFMSC